MGLKASESFFRFVTMGAAGALRAIEILNGQGHDVYELERYSTSNKIWQTKIKRLRLPDLFCLRCGTRFEVRAKSKLEVKMSDSPTVADREWDAGLRDEDVILFIQCGWQEDVPTPASRVDGFRVGTLRATEDVSKLGPPKSAGEGAERDRTWPTIVPGSSGEVLEISEERLRTRLETGRCQTYRLQRATVRLHSYIGEGHTFYGGREIVAGAPERKANLGCSGGPWRFQDDLRSEDPLTRFAAVKSAGLQRARELLETVREIAVNDRDPRVRLEAIGALLRLEEEGSADLLIANFDSPERSDLRMESVLIAGEVGNAKARRALRAMLERELDEEDEELLAAIIWSLGVKGCEDYMTVLGYFDHPSDLVATHATVALGGEYPPEIEGRLLAALSDGGRSAASAAWALQHADKRVIPSVVELARSTNGERHWAVAVLGKRNPDEVVPHVSDSPELQAELQAWWTMASGRNWLSSGEGADLIDFVSRQTL